MAKYKSKFTGQQIDDGIEYAVRVTQQTFSSAQKQQARENIGVTPEVQVGGNTPASDSGVKLFVDEDSDDTVEVYTKAQATGQFMVVVNSVSVPTTSTLTYTSTDGTTKSFKVGDEIRVPDAEADNGYTFYKLYALTTEEGVTTATWDKLGGGGGNPSELVEISLTQFNGNSADLIGATITIIDDDSGDTLFTATWNGNVVKTEISLDTVYTISVSSINGYVKPQNVSYTAGYYTRKEIVLTYSGYGVYIEATDGSLYTNSKWSSAGKIANSVVVLNETHSIRIALSEANLSIHNANNAPFENYLPLVAYSNWPSDMDGKTNTDKIIQFNTAYGTNTTAYAAPYCKAFTFPNGTGNAYMPSVGELYIFSNNSTAINSCLSTCGGTQLGASGKVICSTYIGIEYGSDRSIAYYNNGGVSGMAGIGNKYYVRPIALYE